MELWLRYFLKTSDATSGRLTPIPFAESPTLPPCPIPAHVFACRVQTEPSSLLLSNRELQEEFRLVAASLGHSLPTGQQATRQRSRSQTPTAESNTNAIRFSIQRGAPPTL